MANQRVKHCNGASCDVRRRRLLRGGTALVGGMLATPVTRAFAQSGTSSPATSMLNIGLIRNPVSGLIAIVSQNGWFRDAGLNLSIVPFAGAAGPKIIQAMGGGSVEMSSVSVTAMLLALAARAVPLRIVSVSTDPAPVFAILSAPEIGSMAQLAGKKVATPAGTGLHYFLVRALAKHGMTLKDIEFVNLPAADAQAAFLANRVDAVVPSLNGRYYIQGYRKDTRELFTHESFTRPPGPTQAFINYDVFVAPQSVVDTNPAGIRAFLAAYHGKGVPYLKSPSTQNAAIAGITTYVNTEQKNPTDESAMRQQLLKSGFYDVAGARALLTSDAFRAGLEDQVRFLMDAGRLKEALPLDAVIVPGLLGT